MALYCRLCGVRTDGVERLGVYCPGPRCGTDLRATAHGGVQAWCEPERQRGRPGRTATVRLTVRNAAAAADSYRIEALEPVEGRLEFDEAAFAAPLAPGGVRTVEVRYTPPPDRVGLGLDIASRFGVPGADVAGQANDAAGARFGVALRVASRTSPQAACVAFAVDVPGRVHIDRSEPHAPGGTAGAPAPVAARHGMPLLIGAVVLVLIAAAAVVAVNAGKGSDDEGESAGPLPRATATVSVDAPDVPGVPPSPTTPGHGNGDGNGGGKGGGKGNSTPSPGITTTPPPSVRKQVPMRDLYGLPLDTAERELAEDGLTARVVVDAHSGRPKGSVNATEPEEGVLVDVGGTVVLHVTDGMFQLADYVGQDKDNAASSLRQLGLEPVMVAADDNTPVPNKQIIATSPPAGSWVSEGDKVTLTYHYKLIK